MNRDMIKKLFPEATEDQITRLLNEHHTELQAEKKVTEEWKNKAGKAQMLEEQNAELERQKEEAERQKEEAETKNLSEVEVLKRELAKRNAASEEQNARHNAQMAELKAQLAAAEINSYAASKNLSGESVANILKSFGTDVDLCKSAIDSLVTLVDEREKAAVSAYEAKIMAETKTARGAIGTGNNESIAEKLAVESAKRSASADEKILEYYRR